jgi:uncharacterized membrane protein
VRLFGHPIHPMQVHFPIALWTVAAGGYLAREAGIAEAAEIAKLGNAAGLAMAVLAMIAGRLELRSIDARSEAMRVATAHMMTMAGLALLPRDVAARLLGARARRRRRCARLVPDGGRRLARRPAGL